MFAYDARRPAFLLAWLLTLAACGGGGGGGSGGDSGPPPAPVPAAPPAPPPSAPPAPPTPSYQGRTTPATINDATAGALADAAFYALVLGLDVADASSTFLIPAGEFDRTQAGPDGGSARFVGRQASDGTGWMSITLDQYRNGEVTLNGLEVVEILQMNTSFRLSYHDLSIMGVDWGVNLAGSMMLNGRLDLSSVSTATGTVRVREIGSGFEVLAESVSLQRTRVTGGYELTGGARVYSAPHGWINLTFETPLVFASGSDTPHYGGALIGTAQDGRALRLDLLTPSLASLQYSSSTPGVFDRAARVNWLHGFASQTMRPRISIPSANAGASRSAVPGTTVRLEGAFSEHPEAAFLSFHWRLKHRPPGSNPAWTESRAVAPVFTLDAPGSYLFELETTDEIRTSRDWVALTADIRAPNSAADVGGQFGRVGPATIGASVRVDTSLVRARALSGSFALSATVQGLDGDIVPATYSAGELVFAAAEQGIYRVGAYGGAAETIANQLDSVFVPVIETVRFVPAIQFATADTVRQLVAADVDNDGRSDIVVVEDDAIEVFFFDNQSMSLPVTLPVPNDGGLGSIGVGDLSGDGLMDIVSQRLGVVSLYRQTANRSFSAALPLATACGTSGTAPVVIADLNGDGRMDVAAVGCFANVSYWLQRSDGAFEAERVAPSGLGTTFFIAGGDVSGDGIDDVVATFRGDQVAPNIAVLRGGSGTTLAAPEFLGPALRHDRLPMLVVADLNRDNRDDVVFAARATVNGTGPDRVRVYLQNSSGMLVEGQTLDSPYRNALLGASVGDFNHDGAPDIGVYSSVWTFAVHYQIGNGVFAPQTRAAFDARAQVGGDFNGDGLTDVASIRSDGDAVIVLLGMTPSP